ncbi:hypothetical protein, partial [Comamonas sp. B-9]|uniref:hypothetical protein n=1 Tax=Comamonas sp. B-9 TaxID=1055192 RepID=UPI00195533D6
EEQRAQTRDWAAKKQSQQVLAGTAGILTESVLPGLGQAGRQRLCPGRRSGTAASPGLAFQTATLSLGDLDAILISPRAFSAPA